MKKSLYIGAMAALLLGTASCSNDMEPVVTDGSEVAANFTLNLGDAVDSRAISDGEKADQLTFYVYENGKEIQALRQTVAVTDKHATVTTKLVKGHTYSFVFWAQNSNCAAYTINNTNDGNYLAVSYDNAPCNDENRDAFYEVMPDYPVTASFTEDVVLTRPFAQLNILATDAASVTDFQNYTSALSCTDLSNTMTVLDGKVGTATSTCGFTAAALPSESLPGYEQYKLVATGYFLASTEKTMTSVDFALTYNGNTDTKTIANVPLQRNYRTNIIGDFFTEGANYNIEIDPMYIGNHDVDLDATVFNVTNKDEFDAALASDAKKIIINLGEGVFEYKAQHAAHIKYGGDNTQSITIIGAGTDKTLIKGVTTYRSQITTNNPDCVVTFKNMSVTSIHVDANGVEDQRFAATWDGYDYAICCNFVAENVKFLKSVSICNSKTVLLKNTIIEEHKAYGLNGSGQMVNFDSYALWIEAGTNVTLDGCTIDAKATNGKQNRGIKISDQYTYNGGGVPTMSYLTVKNTTFKSDKKAAILVGTVAGANIAIDGIDITEVAADNVNAVWIDNGTNEKGMKYLDYKDLVTVTGAICIDEP